MNYLPLAPLARPVSRLVQGTLALGQHEPDDNLRLLDAIFAEGCNAFDTARVYAAGETERRLGRWVHTRGVRDEVILITKGCHPKAGLPRVDPTALADDVAASLEALAVDQIDLYLLHRDDPSVPVGEIVTALNEQLGLGRLRAFGASNWTHERIHDANEYARQHGLSGFCASSPGFSLAFAEHSWPGCVTLVEPEDAAALAWYSENQLPLLAWSPLAAGFLSGRYPLGAAAQDLDPTLSQAREFYASERNFERLSRLLSLSQTRGLPVSQLALSYVFHVNTPVFAVVGCKTSAEFRGAKRALDTELSASELAWLLSGQERERLTLHTNG